MSSQIEPSEGSRKTSSLTLGIVTIAELLESMLARLTALSVGGSVHDMAKQDSTDT